MRPFSDRGISPRHANTATGNGPRWETIHKPAASADINRVLSDTSMPIRSSSTLAGRLSRDANSARSGPFARTGWT